MVSRARGAHRVRTTATVVVLALMLGIGAVAVAAFSSRGVPGTCSTGPVAMSADQPTVAGFSDAQVQNARAIIAAGTALGASSRDLTIGVMTAIGESGLCVLDYGDAAGPDSRGLFQQRPAWWGPESERMDPTISATKFFTALLRVADRDALEPTIAAHRVQRNADPRHYERYWDRAVLLVGALDAASAE